MTPAAISEAEAERQPERLRTEAVRDLRLPGSRRSPDLCGRPVLEEVEDAEDAAQDDGRNSECRQLRTAEMTDDRRVDEEVQRFSRKRAERRHRELQNLAVVLAAETHYSARTMRAPLDCASALTTISSMFTCGGRVKANRTQSATSSGVTGSMPA